MVSARWRRALSATAIGVAVIAAPVTLPTAALAKNSLKCNEGFTSSAEGYYANCDLGAPGDQFRPFAVCHLQAHPNVRRYGAWKHNGLTEVFCPSGYDAVSGGIQRSDP